MTTTYRDCPVDGCDGEWAFDLVDSEGPDWSVGLMGYRFDFALDLEWSCEHAAALSSEERETVEIRVGNEYAESGAWVEDAE